MQTRTLLTHLTVVTLALSLVACAAVAGPNSNGRHVGPQVKNVIVMISDGWGAAHIDAANYYTGIDRQCYENFPVKYFMSTYMVPGSYDSDMMWADFDYAKSGATDSAAAATAMSCGEKTYGGAIGMDVNMDPLMHAMEAAEMCGMATGVVTSVEFSHATPAAFIAHNVSRNNYSQIANEMIYDSAADVVMGCGAPDYDNSGNAASGWDGYVGGAATWTDITDDGLVTGADADGDSAPDTWTVVRDRAAFQALMSGEAPDRVLGIPLVYKTLQQGRGGDGYADPFVVPLTPTVPTLAEMTCAALNVLDNDADGLMLMVEGGAVDWASHANQSGRVIEEQIDFNNAVDAVCQWVQENSNWGETLLIVTGDHECGYLNGPGSDPDWMRVVDNGPGNLPGMEWHSGSHTNQLIPVYAKGAHANRFRTVADEDDQVHGRYIDNTEIGQVIFDVLN